MFPGTHAASTPDRLAVVMGNGDSLTYRELDERSARLAHYWHSCGLRPDDHVAILSENQIGYYEVIWAALRSGLHLTPINWHLAGSEIAYILADSGAKALVATEQTRQLANEAIQGAPSCTSRLVMGPAGGEFLAYHEAVGDMPARRLEEEPRGEFMLYSSGTTGKPKGVKRQLSGRDVRNPVIPLIVGLMGLDGEARTLVPAPMYHAAPLIFSTATHVAGGTLVCMEKFETLEALELMHQHRISHSQWVPTHFHRLLKVPRATRDQYDLSSLRAASHTAAPCPPHLKQQMIEWWGPVLFEYYGGSEGNGLTFCDSEEWLAHPGTVGRAVLGNVRICGDDGDVMPVGHTGLVYFEMPSMPFRYHNDPDKTASVVHPHHDNWSTLGDVGHLDSDGYLHLTDRATFMIVSGGVNVYPQETENVLLEHPKVRDAAVFGIPHEDLGEQVLAVVELFDEEVPSDEMARELIDFVRSKIAHFKAPRLIEFTDQLPRTETGKLMKRTLREPYWRGAVREARVSPA